MESSGTSAHVVFAGGTTGGHLFPGLAVAERLAADMPQVRITFAGQGRPFERQQVALAGFSYLPLPCRPWPRRFGEVVRFVAENLRGFREAGRFLSREGVTAVVGLGSYASVPMARAALQQRVPLVLLEQNAVPGRATRWLAPAAAVVCTAFPQAGSHFSRRCPVRVTGNPVRSSFTSLSKRTQGARAGRDGESLCAGTWGASDLSKLSGPSRLLVVLGGSSGARSLNQNVPRAVHKARGTLDQWRIVHQSGIAELEATRKLYRKLGLKAIVVPFVADMAELLAGADLAICRAGGTTLAELAAIGVPAILVPYPHATDDHQRKNADVLAGAGASLTLDERELPGRLDDHLAGAIALVAGNPALRGQMSAAMRRLAHPDAAWDVATLIRQLAAVRPVEVAGHAAARAGSAAAMSWRQAERRGQPPS